MANNSVMGDINRLNRYNTKLGGGSVARSASSSASAIAPRTPSKSGSMLSRFMGAAKRFATGKK